MKIIFSAIGLILLMFLCFYIYFTKTKERNNEVELETLSAEEYFLLREGDFVFRLGYGMISFFLELQTGASGVSHIGVLVKNGDDFDVIHSISGSMAELDGVQKISLNDFLFEAKPGSFVTTRLKNANEKSISKEAERLLAKRVPFNIAFDIKDTNKLFCSQFINVILQNTHKVEVFSQEAKEFPFSGFFDTSKFEIIIDKRDRESLSESEFTEFRN